MAVIFTDPFWQFLDSDGEPLANGYIFTYSAGTTSLKDTFTTDAATVVNPNPIPLDAAGRPQNQIWIQGSYRFDLYDVNDALVKSIDNVTSFTALNESGDPFFQSFSGTGSQTVFTLTESLGDDSKDILVFVNDESGDVGYNVQNPSAYTLSGTSLTFNSAPSSGTNNIYVYAPTKLLGAASAAAAAAEAAETAAVAAQNAAEAAAGTVAITSTTSLAIGTGSKVFTVDAGLSVTAGQWVIITSDADPLVNYMTGQIASYSGTTLTVTVDAAFGSGTLDDWTIKLSGVRGAIGETGAVSATSGVVAATTAGAALKSSNGNDCILWGAGGSANSTLGGNMSGASTHKLVNMADGTSAQDYVTKAQLDGIQSGGWVPIGTPQTVTSAVASVDFTSGIDSTYKTYAIVFSGVEMVNNAVLLSMRLGNGGTFDSGASDYTTTASSEQAGGSQVLSGGANSELYLTTAASNDASFGLCAGIVYIDDPAETGLYTYIHGHSTHAIGTARAATIFGGSRNEAAAHDRIRILASSGNIENGVFTLYGLAGA
jgi:hypothetical protein